MTNKIKANLEKILEQTPVGLAVEKAKVATRYYLATDMGTGGSHCGSCNYSFGSDLKRYDNCPSCKLPMVDSPVSKYSFGGSDF